MNIQETAAVLAKIKIGDNREVDSKGLVLREWHEAIGDLDYADAIEAVAMHRRESQAYLLPAHVRANVQLIRTRRARSARYQNMGQITPTPGVGLDRAEFDRLTNIAIAEARAKRRHAHEIQFK
jgi:hypothetical protein